MKMRVVAKEVLGGDFKESGEERDVVVEYRGSGSCS